METEKIIDYKVVKCHIFFSQKQEMIEKFEKEILELIKKGYITIGGVAVSDNILFQALIKYED